MAGRGPAPTPTQLKILKGNPGRRPLNRQEAQVASGIPTAPTELEGEAKAEWERIVPLLAEAGLLTRVDRGGLVMACQAWGRWITLQAEINRQGMLIKNRKGMPALNPLIRRQDECVSQFRPLLQEFGMSPSSRSRIKVDVPPQKTKVDLFREKHGG